LLPPILYFVFMFCAPGLILAGTERVRFRFKFCTLELVCGGTDDVRSRFHVLRSLTLFGRYQGRRVPFSCFALLDSFWAILRVSGPVFMFCTLELIFDGTEGAWSRFHILRYQTRLGLYRVRHVEVFSLAENMHAI
jgi:hypothetical protein